jgi:hypothetical protein
MIRDRDAKANGVFGAIAAGEGPKRATIPPRTPTSNC